MTDEKMDTVTMEVSSVVAIALTISAIFWYAFQNTKKKNGKAPPSLPRLPFVGSIPFLRDLSNLPFCLTEKSKTYGKIFSFVAGSKSMLVLNSDKLIREALVKNSVIYSGRGETFMHKYVFPDHGLGLAMVPSSDVQRKMRSTCLTVLKNFGFGSRTVLERKIQEEVSHLLQYVHSMDGKAWYPAHILEHSTMNVIHNLMFGKRYNHDDKIGQNVAYLCHEYVESLDMMYDIFPIVARFPHFKRKLEHSKIIYNNFMEFCEEMVEESTRSDGIIDDNFVREYLKIDSDMTNKKRAMAAFVRDLILAGTETTAGQLNWALILLANHPDVQSRLQQEIDSVVPRDRLPSLVDKPRLSYLEAVILEVLRFRPIAPLTLPHVTLDYSEIAGYAIPFGTEIIVNIWSAHMDPEVWNKPEFFNPDRFLDENGVVVNRELMITFSLGKRSCLGEILARQELFLFLSVLVQQFHILPPDGELTVKDDMVFVRALTAVKHTMRLVARNSY